MSLRAINLDKLKQKMINANWNQNGARNNHLQPNSQDRSNLELGKS
jgi:hypothetical protein